jgi:outer membrane protein assembly factor BamB
VAPASDVFSLGSVLCFAATGQPPFGDGNAPAVLYRIVHEPPALDAIPGGLRDLIARCLAKDPAARPALSELISSLPSQTGGWDRSFWPAAVLAAIRAPRDTGTPGLQATTHALRDNGTLGPQATIGRATATAQHELAPPAPATAPESPSRRRALALFGGIGGVAVAGVAVGAWQLDSGPAAKPRHGPTPPARTAPATHRSAATKPGKTRRSHPASRSQAVQLLWQTPQESVVYELAMTKSGICVLTSAIAELAASTGKQLWASNDVDPTAPTPSSLMAALGDAVFWINTGGGVTAADASTGATLWNGASPASGAFELIATGPGTPGLVACTNAEILVAFSSDTGSTLVRASVDQSSAVACGNGTAFVATGYGYIKAFTTGTTMVWSKAVPDDLTVAGLTVTDGILIGAGYPSAGDGGSWVIFALSTATGSLLWRHELGTIVTMAASSSVLAYIGSGAESNPNDSPSGNGELILRDVTTGALLGTDQPIALSVTQQPGNVFSIPLSGPLAVTGSLVLASSDAGVIAFDGGSGQQLWQRSLSGSVTNIAADGSLACVVTSEQTYGFQLSSG